MPEKVCTQCGLSKDVSLFYKQAANKDGIKSECADCNKERVKKGYNRKIEERRAAKKEQFWQNRETILKRNRESYQRNKESWKKHKKEYTVKNKGKIRIRANKFEKRKRKEDPKWKLIKNYRDRIRKACNSSKLPKSKIKYLGCTGEEFKAHLESKFTSDMNWNNYGSYWVVDHIIPISWFNVENESCRNKAFHYTNTQPLVALLNAIKRDKWHDFVIEPKIVA